MKKTITLLLFLCCLLYLKATDAVLKHSYSFSDGAKDTPGSGIASVDGILNGGGTISNGVYTNTTDGYISFDGSALALNTYSAITLEAYIHASNGLNGDNWAVLANFGNDGDNYLFMSNTRGGWIGTTAAAKTSSASSEIAYYPKKDDGLLHHIVTVLSGNVLKLYVDGVLLESKTGAPTVADLGTAVAYLGASMWGWDPKWRGSIYEFNIYDGELSAAEVAANNTALYNATKSSFESISTAASMSLSVGALNGTFSSDVTTYSVFLPNGTTSVKPTLITTTAGSVVTGDGVVDVSSGTGTSNIAVTSINGQSTTNYVVNYIVWNSNSLYKMHSYTFINGVNDLPGVGIHAANGILNGNATVSNGVLTLGGGWVSFDGTALNLNSYYGITMEYYLKPEQGANAGHFNWLSYFGGDWGGDCLMVGANTWGQYRSTKNNYGDGAIEVNNTDDGDLHYVVTVLNGGKLKMYADGVKIGEVTATTSTIGTKNAYLGRAFWPDPSWLGKVDEFNIYNGELSAEQVAANYQAMTNKNVTAIETAALNMYKNVVVRDAGALTLTNSTSIENLKIQSGGTLLDNGNLTSSNISIQQYLTSGRNWYLSSPVSDATSAVLDAANVSNKLFWYDEANGSTTPWAQITDNTTGLSTLKGYIVNVAASDTLRFNGNLNTGSKTVTLNRTAGQTKEGFNLIGNPYPSYVSWDAVEKSNIEPTMWYRTRNAGNTAYVFDTYNSVGQIGTSLNGEQINCNIPPLQAFWVRVKAAGDGSSTTGTVTFENTMRSHKGSQTVDETTIPDVIRKTRTNQVNSQKLLRLQVSNGVNSDETILLFNTNAADGLDDYDSYKMSNNNDQIPEIYTQVGSVNLVINGMSGIDTNNSLSLGFKTGQNFDSFLIKATQISNFDGDTKIFIRDKVLNKEQEITNGESYTFSSVPTTDDTRFSILFKSPSITTDLNKNVLMNAKTLVDNNNKITITYQVGFSFVGSASVYNCMGQMLENCILNSPATRLQKSLAPGIYFVEIEVNGQKKTEKIIMR